jgi:hypothetical protein
MSVEYYAKLERGSLAGVSAGVLDAIARALQLDDAERAHLLRLAHEADGSNAILRPRRRPRQWTVRPSLQWSLDAITAPAIVGNNRADLLAANHLGRAMYSDLYSDPSRPPNFARFTFGPTLWNGERAAPGCSRWSTLWVRLKGVVKGGSSPRSGMLGPVRGSRSGQGSPGATRVAAWS